MPGHVRGFTNTLPFHVEAVYNDDDFADASACAALLARLAVVTVAAKTALEKRTAA